jgi:hypothetical protein
LNNTKPTVELFPTVGFPINRKAGFPLILASNVRGIEKAKIPHFGFFLYLLAKTAVYWLFSQNNRSMEANHFLGFYFGFGAYCIRKQSR